MKRKRNFSTVRKMVKGVRMVHQDLLRRHPLDPVAERILDCMRGRISPALQGHFMQLLRSFDEEMITRLTRQGLFQQTSFLTSATR